MKTWLIKTAVGILGVAIVLVMAAGVWAMIVSGSGEPVPPVLQLAGTGVRAMLGLAVAASPGILFWLVVVCVALVTRRVRRSALWSTVQDETRHSQGQSPVA